jgi:hypothetical protein
MSIDHGMHTAELNDEMTRRALQLVLDKTTDMAAETLKVPLHYYRDPKLTEIEESQILRRTPLAILPSAPGCIAGHSLSMSKANDHSAGPRTEIFADSERQS